MTQSTIAHVLTSLQVGGGERVALLLAAEQARRGHRVAIVSLEEPAAGPLAAAFASAGARVVRVPKRHGFDASLCARLYATFVLLRPDIVHSHNPLPLIYAAPAAKLARAAVVHTKHGPHPDRARRVWLRRQAARCCDAFVAVTQTTADFARELSEVPARKLCVIDNGIDLAAFAATPERRRAKRTALGLAAESFVVGTVGRMAAVKDHATLLCAFAALRPQGALLVIAGDGPEAANTRALARRLRIADRVLFLGACDDVPALLAALDVFALSSSSEGLPLALIEAMAAGLPIVATAVGGVPDAVGDAGLLAPPRDPAALGRAIASLRADPARAGEMGVRASERAAAKYSAMAMNENYLQLYSSIRKIEISRP